MKQSFKLTLAAACAAAAFAGSAAAADVTLYGSVSTGMVYEHADKLTTGGEVVKKKTNSASMQSAWYGDSIWGITATEDLGDGWRVGVTLESEFNSDDGSNATDHTLFDSQAYINFGNDMVTIAAGRMGTLASGGGDFDLVGGFDPLEAAFGVGGMGTFTNPALEYIFPQGQKALPLIGLLCGDGRMFFHDSYSWNLIAQIGQELTLHQCNINYITGSFERSSEEEIVTNFKRGGLRLAQHAKLGDKQLHLTGGNFIRFCLALTQNALGHHNVLGF